MITQYIPYCSHTSGEMVNILESIYKEAKGDLFDFMTLCRKSSDQRVSKINQFGIEVLFEFLNILHEKSERKQYGSKDLIEILKEYEDFDIEVSIPDEVKDGGWQSSTFYKIVGIADIGYSDKRIILDVEKEC